MATQSLSGTGAYSASLRRDEVTDGTKRRLVIGQDLHRLIGNVRDPAPWERRSSSASTKNRVPEKPAFLEVPPKKDFYDKQCAAPEKLGKLSSFVPLGSSSHGDGVEELFRGQRRYLS
jgi:hypothetical protein